MGGKRDTSRWSKEGREVEKFPQVRYKHHGWSTDDPEHRSKEYLVYNFGLLTPN